ncbi:hypothetical protein CALCODRAFT_189592 [Calocera cornea HHB12733]|uniref:Uncharacterized protein n=1 Tax=Calocera cornea HHB12733 TaxID=1353952 RepID=A0A165C8L4_9BASI|nr:hypothetical protein CALCODRAFT_189592 [Calocera cornea HHB12733]
MLLNASGVTVKRAVLLCLTAWRRIADMPVPRLCSAPRRPPLRAPKHIPVSLPVLRPRPSRILRYGLWWNRCRGHGVDDAVPRLCRRGAGGRRSRRGRTRSGVRWRRVIGVVRALLVRIPFGCRETLRSGRECFRYRGCRCRRGGYGFGLGRSRRQLGCGSVTPWIGRLGTRGRHSRTARWWRRGVRVSRRASGDLGWA